MSEIIPGKYQVIVGNVGTVADTNNIRIARKVYKEYVALSKKDYGRASGEDVTMTVDGEPYMKYLGTLREPGRAMLYENDATRSVGMPATCNTCDRIIYADEDKPADYTARAGNCKECYAEIEDENHVRKVNQD